jgi:hypothetical protein
VKAIVRNYVDVLLLKAVPQVFPKSWGLLAVTLLAYALTDALTFLAQGVYGMQALMQAAFDIALQIGFFGLLLGVTLRLARLNQVLVAWFGACIFLNLVSIPADAAAYLVHAPSLQLPLLVPQLLILTWTIAIMANVFRHALDISMLFSFVIAVVYAFVSISVFLELFPVA